jgi:hypothetical protein
VFPNVLRVEAELVHALLLVHCLERLEIRRKGGLGIDDNLPSTGQTDDQVRSELPVLTGQGLLLVEVAVLEHARQLDHSSKLDLAPSAPDVGVAQRLGQVRGLALQVVLGVDQALDLLLHALVGPDPVRLELADARVESGERLSDRLH